MTKVDAGLYAFLKAYAKWAYEDGAPEGEPFTRGLCYNCDSCFKDRKVWVLGKIKEYENG